MTPLDKIKELFETSSPKEAPPGGMTFEQRAWLIGRLHELTHRGERSLETWLREIQGVLNLTEVTKPFAQAFPGIDKDGDTARPESEVEKLAAERVQSTIRFVEAHPAAAFGGDARHLIAESVEQAIGRSSYVRLAKVVIPTLFVVFGGGVLYGEWKWQGLIEAANQARVDIQKANKAVSDTAGQANKDIAQLSSSLQTSWKAQLETEAQNQLKSLSAVVEQAKKGANDRIDAEVKQIAAWGEERKHEVESAIDTQKNAVNGLAPIVEKAKAEAGQKVQAELDGIRQWGDAKRSDIGAAVVEARTAIAQLVPPVEQAKATAEINIKAVQDSIDEQAKTRKREIDAAAEAQKASINGLTSTIDAAKTDVAPKLRTELDAISKWGDARRTEIDTAAESARAGISQALSAVDRAKADAVTKVAAAGAYFGCCDTHQYLRTLEAAKTRT